MRPTLEVVGMSSGFTGEGVKAVIPRAATAKLSCRLVPGQQPQDIYNKVRTVTGLGWVAADTLHVI
jgi:acetylornithine deacetylase/succinyl-diaminopimelate desuccinylase-like protein